MAAIWCGAVAIWWEKEEEVKAERWWRRLGEKRSGGGWGVEGRWGGCGGGERWGGVGGGGREGGGVGGGGGVGVGGGCVWGWPGSPETSGAWQASRSTLQLVVDHLLLPTWIVFCFFLFWYFQQKKVILTLYCIKNILWHVILTWLLLLLIKMLTLVKQKLFSTWMALLTNNVITSPSGFEI